MSLTSTTLPDTATCLKCGYALRGLPENVCPECGRSFEPDDPRTYRASKPRPWWHGKTDPPPWYYRYPLIAVTIVLLVDMSSPGFSTGFFIIDGMCLYPLCTFILFALAIADHGRRASARSIFRREYPQLAPADKRSRKPWLAVPVCLLLLLSAFVTAWPMHVRFAMSRSAFDAAAKKFVRGSNTVTGPQWIGLYHVQRVCWQSDGEGKPQGVFFETGLTICDTIGFLYSPDRARSSAWWFDFSPPWFIEET